MKPSYVRLPNGAIVAMDDSGYIEAKVQVELASLLRAGIEDALDTLSNAATGTDVLSDISYRVVGHHGGTTLDILVRGSIELIEHEEVSYDELPPVEFEAQVTRIGYGSRTFRLTAKTLDAARDIAADDAGNHTYAEHHADYVIEVAAIGSVSVERSCERAPGNN